MAPRSDSESSPATSTKQSTKPANSNPNYTPNDEEPVNFSFTHLPTRCINVQSCNLGGESNLSVLGFEKADRSVG